MSEVSLIKMIVPLVDIGGIDDRSMFKLYVHNAYLFFLQFQNNKDFFLFIRLPLHIKKTASYNIKQGCGHYKIVRIRIDIKFVNIKK